MPELNMIDATALLETEVLTSDSAPVCISCRCPFPACAGAVRIWARGMAGFSLPYCEICHFALVKPPTDADTVRMLIDRNLI